MGSYLSRITEDVKTAMRAKDKMRLTVLRMMVASIKSEQDRQGVEDLADAEELAIVSRAVKTRKESVQQALDADRQDIADNELAEIEIVQTYLPQQMDGDELATKVQ
ncbi:MAG: GatB/YqeY domain-containing protein, partial [Planctomycetota bacterium]|nr:GatB/YqeY domain-containing protein [Planctomycetota bacterium]